MADLDEGWALDEVEVPKTLLSSVPESTPEPALSCADDGWCLPDEEEETAPLTGRLVLPRPSTNPITPAPIDDETALDAEAQAEFAQGTGVDFAARENDGWFSELRCIVPTPPPTRISQELVSKASDIPASCFTDLEDDFFKTGETLCTQAQQDHVLAAAQQEAEPAKRSWWSRLRRKA